MTATLIAANTSNCPATGQMCSQNRAADPERPPTSAKTGFGALNPRQRAVLSEAPVSARGILERAYSRKSKAAGIRAFCLYCVGYVRTDVRNCTSFGCPLWPYRPHQSDADEADDGDVTEGALT
jgi:hypothetical protein